MSATTTNGPGSVSRTFRAALNRTGDVQKTSKGAPAYSRYINRRLGRYLAAAAYALHMTPNQVTLVSATFSYGAIAAIALAGPTPTWPSSSRRHWCWDMPWTRPMGSSRGCRTPEAQQVNGSTTWLTA